MNFINEFLPEVRRVQMENASRDKKQKNSARYQQFEQSKEQDEENTMNVEEIIWADIERRSGEDRRQQHSERGKWLESRHNKDRRKQDQLYFKI